MNTPMLSAALQDALEKGDVVELEQAIVAAENAMHVSSHARKASASSSLGNLVTRAKDMYLVHMEACRPYVKPLRKACKELNERGIFESLVRARGAPDEVQLCMYTDLCNAEALRHEIVGAQQVATQLLDATRSADIDDFLSECSAFLEDRTVMALVMKREDLAREERRREAGRMTPLRGAAKKDGSGMRGRRDPLEEFGRRELEDEGASPVQGAALTWTPRRTTVGAVVSSPPLVSSGRRPSTPGDGATPRSSAAVPAAYPAVRHAALDRVHESGLQRAVAEGSSPWMQAVRSLRQHVHDEVTREERETRDKVEEVEVEHRAQLYRAAMLERVRCWAETAAWITRKEETSNESEGDDENREEDAARRATPAAPPSASHASAVRVRLPHQPATPSLPLSAPNGSDRSGASPTRVYAHTLSAYPLRSRQQQEELRPHARSPGRGEAAASAAAAEGAILGSALRTRFASTSAATAIGTGTGLQSTPRMSRDTPNISPIKDASSASGVASMWEPEQTFHQQHRGGATKPGWEAGTPRHRDSVGSTGTAASSSMAASPSLELRRIQARLRAVLQEEDIHRRDIEGTEDFDRSVFLFPVSARIAMLRRSVTSRLRLY